MNQQPNHPQPQTWVGRLLCDLGMALGSLRQTFRPRYVKFLERELERLRGENLALWNSLVGTAGVPPPVPMPNMAQAVKVPDVKRRTSWPRFLHRKEVQDRTEHKKTLADEIKEERLRQQAAADKQKGNGAAKDSGHGAGSEPRAAG